MPILSNFQKTLAALNPQQRRAVDRTEGPVAVIAGPGTGKTQLLAARIGQILTKTDTLPQAILCLTYTDAAAHAMRERLLDLIGPDAHRVPITTFHSFCNRVIQENPTFSTATTSNPFRIWSASRSSENCWTMPHPTTRSGAGGAMPIFLSNTSPIFSAS